MEVGLNPWAPATSPSSLTKADANLPGWFTRGESWQVQRAECQPTGTFVTPTTRWPSGNWASASIHETAFVRTIRSPKSGSRSCASHTIRARLKSRDAFKVAIWNGPALVSSIAAGADFQG